MKTKQEYIKSLVNRIAELTKKASSYNEAIEKGLNSYLTLDFNSNYGGYNLVSVNIEGGGHGTAFYCFSSCGNRLKYKDMVNKLESFICGLEIKDLLK